MPFRIRNYEWVTKVRQNGLARQHYSLNHLSAGSIRLRAGAAFTQPQSGGYTKMKGNSLHVHDNFRVGAKQQVPDHLCGCFLLRFANPAVILRSATRLSFTNSS